MVCFKKCWKKLKKLANWNKSTNNLLNIAICQHTLITLVIFNKFYPSTAGSHFQRTCGGKLKVLQFANSWEICCRCAEKLLAHVIFYKNSKIWKNNTSEISTYDSAFLRRRSRKLNCRKNFTNISSMESIYIISILIVDWFKIQAIKLHS